MHGRRKLARARISPFFPELFAGVPELFRGVLELFRFFPECASDASSDPGRYKVWNEGPPSLPADLR